MLLLRFFSLKEYVTDNGTTYNKGKYCYNGSFLKEYGSLKSGTRAKSSFPFVKGLISLNFVCRFRFHFLVVLCA